MDSQGASPSQGMKAPPAVEGLAPDAPFPPLGQNYDSNQLSSTDFLKSESLSLKIWQRWNLNPSPPSLSILFLVSCPQRPGRLCRQMRPQGLRQGRRGLHMCRGGREQETGMEARAGGGAHGCTAKLSHCSVYKSSQPGDGPNSPNMLQGAPFGPRAERHPEVSGAGHTAVSRVSSIFRELVSCSESILSQLVL